MGLCSKLRALGLAALSVAGGAGCGVAEGPELLELSSAGPGLVESGGALSVVGRGFPAGRVGRVDLTGVSLVPGRDPQRVRASLTGHAASSGRVVVNLGETEVRRITAEAPHATFRGTLSIAFEPVRAGAPALRGHLNDLTLDVLEAGAVRNSPSEFSTYLGLQLGPDLSVTGVTSGLPADAAGLRLGDRLHRLDGVRLLTLSDFAPAAHGTQSLLEYSRPGYDGRGEVLLARADYYRWDDATIWLTVSIGMAALFGLLLAARPPRATIWLLQTGRRIAQRRAGRVGWPWSIVGAAAGSVGVAWIQHSGSATRLDLPLLGGACLGSLLLATLLADGRRSGQGFSLARGVWGALLSTFALVPLVLAWILPAIEVGTLSLVELSASQAVAPLAMGVLSSPWTLLSAACCVLALVPSARERPPTGPATSDAAPVVRLLEECGLGLGLVAWVLLYGGGLGAPVLPFAVDLGLGFAKLLLLFGLVRWLRVVSGRASRRESWDLLGFPLALTSLLAFAARLVLLRLDLTGALDAKLRWLPLACLLSALLWLGLSALRSLSHHGRRADPWL
jgi:hypothetical protein